MGATGSIRGAAIDGLQFNATGDANIALSDRYEKTSIPHTGGNMTQFTLAAGNAEPVKLTLTASEYDTLRTIAAGLETYPMSYTTADGSSFKTVGHINLGPFQSEDNSCEVMFMTATGVWDIFAAE